MKLLRKLLVKALGFEGYLRLVSRMYIIMVGSGRGREKYPELFFLKRIIRPGFTCVDIGANLGYYSTFLSRLAGPKGKVLAVEPVPLFGRIWRDNVKASGVDNLTLLPFALGGENTTIEMGTPVRDGLVHHGMTKIASSAQEQYAQTYQVEMRVPDELFLDLDRLDFIKCDVEGYEHQVFAHLQETIKKFRPLIQTELNGAQNRRAVVETLARLGYGVYTLTDKQTLSPCSPQEIDQYQGGDFYFKPNPYA
ncbi:FkbM family methyltransferase [Rufibacter hautae]|uniref:FkbM family methyltransferase n=1 Tax=Rufibacter hautae TaxID=2595005 RepID=A0A5B6TIE5_9BACT|nr:FkbM family methyltransferase [Rufibacter hautae]KAA3440191.1 FkbM family methyltransferase [Rufibacter hautae]